MSKKTVLVYSSADSNTNNQGRDGYHAKVGMKYYIKRDLNEYGPYTLADLQRYVAQGNIAPTDLTRSEGITDWVPVSQVLGTIAVPPPAPAAVSAPGVAYAANAAGAPQPAALQTAPAYAVAPTQAVPGPVPPDLHWALVLVIGFFCGIFTYAWLFIEASFVKKLRPQSNFLSFLIAGICMQVGSVLVVWVSLIATAASGSNEPPIIPLLLFFVVLTAGVAVYIVGLFKMRDAMQEYYNTVEPINLRLSGVMTFFFNIYYFQYHFTRIAQWKRTGVLAPQG